METSQSGSSVVARAVDVGHLGHRLSRNLELMEEPVIVLNLPANCSNVGAWNIAANSNDDDGDRIRRSKEVVDAVGYAL